MSVFRDALEFFYEIGVYDVVLPFLLVFTIVFAMLEKTKVFGQIDIDGKKYTRKNQNAMVAFVTSFFVVGSTQLVAIINQTLSQVVLLLILIVFFLLLAGSFHKDEAFFLEKGWQTAFMWITLIGVVLIFLNAAGWLNYAYGYFGLYWNTVTVSSILLLVMIIVVMMFVTKDPTGKPKN